MRLQWHRSGLASDGFGLAISPAAFGLIPESIYSVCRDIICYTIDTLPAVPALPRRRNLYCLTPGAQTVLTAFGILVLFALMMRHSWPLVLTL